MHGLGRRKVGNVHVRGNETCVSARRIAIVAIGAAIGLLGVTGCSSSGSTAASPSSTAPRTSNTSGAARTDKTIVASVVLKATDLPGSWNQGAAAENDTSGDAQMARCLGIPNDDESLTAYIGSPEFSKGGTQISARTYAYKSESVVEADLRGADKPQLATCLAALATGQGATNVHVSKTPMPSTAGSLRGFRVTGSLDTTAPNGSLAHVVIDEVALAKGRIETDIDVETLERTLPAGLIDRLTAALAQRLEQTAS